MSARGMTAGVIGAGAVDPTAIVCWNTPGPTSNAVIKPGNGANLVIQNFQGSALITLADNSNSGAFGSPGNPTFGTSWRMGPDSGDYLEVGNNGQQGVIGGTLRWYIDNGGVWKWVNATSVIWYQGNATDPRWTQVAGDFMGEAAIPADGAKADSPSITLRAKNDPVGAGALQNLDAVLSHVSAPTGATVDSALRLTIRGIIVTMIHFDVANGVAYEVVEGIATASFSGNPSGGEGSFYYDTTLKKLRVWTGAAWETVTSV